MQLIQTISMDFAVHGVAPRVFGKQDDSLSRLVRISLSNNGVAWAIPSDAIFMLRYRTPSGGVGLYDTLPDGSSAFSVAGNAVTVALVDQIFATAGVAECDLRIISDGAGASTWTFLVEVDRGPTGDNIVSSDYINVLTSVAAQVAADANRAQMAANSIDTSLLMQKSTYDSSGAVAQAGGISSFVFGVLGGIDTTGLKVATGWYTGSNTVGPVEISFDFEPYLVIVSGSGHVVFNLPIVLFRGASLARGYVAPNILGYSVLDVTWGEKNVSWKAKYYRTFDAIGGSLVDRDAEVTSIEAMNASQTSYRWIAIGK